MFKKRKEEKQFARREALFTQYQQLLDSLDDFQLTETANFKQTDKLRIIFSIGFSEGETRKKAEHLYQEIEEGMEALIEKGVRLTEEELLEFENTYRQTEEGIHSFFTELRSIFQKIREYDQKLKTTKKEVLEKLQNQTFYPDDIANKLFKVEEAVHDIQKDVKTDPFKINFAQYDDLMKTLTDTIEQFDELYRQTVAYIEKMSFYETEHQFNQTSETEKQKNKIPLHVQDYLETKEKLFFNLHKGNFDTVASILKSLEGKSF